VRRNISDARLPCRAAYWLWVAVPAERCDEDAESSHAPAAAAAAAAARLTDVDSLANHKCTRADAPAMRQPRASWWLIGLAV